MKPNSLIFSFSPDGTQHIVCCAWCEKIVPELDIPSLLDIAISDIPISHGICDKHLLKLKQEIKKSNEILTKTEIDIINSDFKYFASRS